MKERYINPFTDFGFKKIFGTEKNKDLLIDFLESLLPEKGKIKNLTFSKTEHLGSAQEDRKAIFDLYCENENGEKYIVELQKAKQLYFKDRSLYYATFPIQEQAIVGDWNFKINAVYTIALMDFIFNDTADGQYLHNVQLVETNTNKVFNEKLRFIYIEMPKFAKEEKQLKTHLDKWMYVLKNLAKLEQMPKKVREKVFEKLFTTAEIANYTSQERQAYQQSQKYSRDWKNVLDTTLEEGMKKGVEIGIEKGIQVGMEKGMEKGMIEATKKKNRDFVLSCIKKGFDNTLISELINLSAKEIHDIRNELQKSKNT